MSDTQITLTSHDFKKGDLIRMEFPEHRWWMRFWYWLASRKPVTVQYSEVTSVTNTTLTVDE